jgi:hypothetical protein
LVVPTDYGSQGCAGAALLSRTERVFITIRPGGLGIANWVILAPSVRGPLVVFGVSKARRFAAHDDGMGIVLGGFVNV